MVEDDGECFVEEMVAADVFHAVSQARKVPRDFVEAQNRALQQATLMYAGVEGDEQPVLLGGVVGFE